jgi:hypothetical protein
MSTAAHGTVKNADRKSAAMHLVMPSPGKCGKRRDKYNRTTKKAGRKLPALHARIFSGNYFLRLQ